MAGAEVLVAGAEGGRELALAAAMQESSEVSRVEVSAKLAAGLELFRGGRRPFIVIGPEALLVQGAADELREQGYTVLGPGRKAAQYEASKAFAVEMMQQSGVPHPETFISRGPVGDNAYISNYSPDKYVIKADGLASGKGVVLPANEAEAREAVRAMRAGEYGGAGKEIILFADRHRGPEVSAMALVGDNDDFTLLPLAQDHKRLGDGDTGPNTGGMGAYAPVPESIVSPWQHELFRELTADSLAGMRAHGVPFRRGVLLIGAMLSEQWDGDPAVIEYNVRFGDPETQAVMPLLAAAGVDVFRLLRSAAEGDLEKPAINFAKLSVSALTVCLAAAGYPDAPRKGDAVYGVDRKYPGVTVQQAAVKDGLTNGGRVLYVTGTGPTLQDAAARVYSAIDIDQKGQESGGLGFKGMQFRRDIGHQALQAA